MGATGFTNTGILTGNIMACKGSKGLSAHQIREQHSNVQGPWSKTTAGLRHTVSLVRQMGKNVCYPSSTCRIGTKVIQHLFQAGLGLWTKCVIIYVASDLSLTTLHLRCGGPGYVLRQSANEPQLFAQRRCLLHHLRVQA